MRTLIRRFEGLLCTSIPMIPSPWTLLFRQFNTKSFIKDDKPPEVIIICAAFDFKNLLNDRLPKVSSWTNNLCYRFAKTRKSSSRIALQISVAEPESPHYFGHFHDEPVRERNKALASKAESDPNAYCLKWGSGCQKGPHWRTWHRRKLRLF